MLTLIMPTLIMLLAFCYLKRKITGKKDRGEDEDCYHHEPTGDTVYVESLAKGPLPMPFRVLILGRANAGKTTILERITGGSEADALVFRDGKLLEGQEVKGQADRGLHSVEDEIIFPSRPGFIFHDSRGFEAGSEEELKKVRQFVEASPETTNLREQLHAIWMCLPLDEARDLFDSEKEVFEWSRGRTPLVVIFTKRDGAITKFTKQLIQNAPEGTTVNRSFKNQARRQADVNINIYIEQQKENLQSKASDDPDAQTIVFLTTSKMGEVTNETADTCNRLIEATENALSGPTLQSSLCQAWGKNFDRLAYWTFYGLLGEKGTIVILKAAKQGKFRVYAQQSWTLDKPGVKK